jgi:Nucleotide-binding protein implicated in inhibition of septum formation
MPVLTLASGSGIRRRLLEAASVPVEIRPARVDEDALRAALAAEGASPRDTADALAEAKARKIAARTPGLVLGCDQILAVDRDILAKPTDLPEARAQLARLSGRRHDLFSAAVIYEDAAPVWRHVGHVRLHMRPLSDTYLDAYLARNWDSVRDSVGAYKLEEEGARLFSRIDGDYFTVLGLPLLEVLSYLALRGVIDT